MHEEYISKIRRDVLRELGTLNASHCHDSSTIEIELRFGRKHGDKFVPGLTVDDFDMVMSRCVEPMTDDEMSTVPWIARVTSDLIYRDGLRVTTEDGAFVCAIHKQRLTNVDVPWVNGMWIRLSVCMETPLTDARLMQTGIEMRQPTLIRRKNRRTLSLCKNDDLSPRLDLTEVFSGSSKHLEIEIDMELRASDGRDDARVDRLMGHVERLLSCLTKGKYIYTP